METGCIVTPLGREWARPLRALGVQCQLKSSASRWTQVRYIHTAATHSHYTLQWAGTSPKFPLAMGTGI